MQCVRPFWPDDKPDVFIPLDLKSSHAAESVPEGNGGLKYLKLNAQLLTNKKYFSIKIIFYLGYCYLQIF